MSIEAMNWARKVGRAGAELGLLGPGAILLLWSLADRADEAWSCFPSIEKDLAPDSAQSERSIERHLKLYREHGIVTTEERRNSLGYRIGGHRFYLHEGALAELEARVNIARIAAVEDAIDTNEKPVIPVSANLAGRDGNPEIPVSANLAGRDGNPEIPVSANLAGREPSRQIGGSLPAKLDKNSQGAFKRNARGFNHHHQSSPETTDDDLSATVSDVDDPAVVFDGWQTGIDNEMALVHRRVDVLALATTGAMFGLHQPVHVWHRVIDLVLERSSGTVRMPHAYVLASFAGSARTVMVEALKSLETPTETAQKPAGTPIMVKCEEHSWSAREGAMCPSCRADALAGEPAEDEAPAPLTEEQISKLPEAYRHMARAGFAAPTVVAQDLMLESDFEDVAPWDRERVNH